MEEHRQLDASVQTIRALDKTERSGLVESLEYSVFLWLFASHAARKQLRPGVSLGARSGCELEAGFALAHFADDEGRYAVFLELAEDTIGVVAAGDDDEADAHVENAEHFGLVDGAQALQPAEHRWYGPAVFAEKDAAARGQHARHVAFQPFPCDVGQTAHHAALDRIMPQDVLDRPYIDARRLQQFFADRPAQFRHEISDVQPSVLEHHLAHQAVTVGVQASAGQAEYHVAGLDGPSTDDMLALDHSDAETGHVIIAWLIKVGQNGRF